MTFYELLKNIINKLGLAVRTDAQILSDEQKAQVIENIGAVSENISINGQPLSSDVTLIADDVGVYVQPEEPANAIEGDIWVDTDAESHLNPVNNEIFLIGDVTTTEEVGIISFDTDIKCRKLYANFTVPKDVPLNKPCISVNCEDNSEWGVYGNNIDRNNMKKYFVECELIKGYGIKYYMACNGSSTFLTDLESGAIFKENSDIQALTHFHIASDYAQTNFPVGVRLMVWGVKQ